MAGASDYRKEQFIQQYEHIVKLNLLSDEELNQVKRKRSFFEISVKNSSELKNYINYIKYEIALMKKFKQVDNQNENDSRALDNAIKIHVMDLFRMTLKKFQDKRKIWDHYLAFAKQKAPNSVSGIYQEMLHFHHSANDYIEAAQHEISKKNYKIALDLLEQGMGRNKDSSHKLVVNYIECSLKEGESQDAEAQESHILQASKFYDKFLKNSTDVSIHCELLQKIQQFHYTISFQNDVITHLIETYAGRATVWEVFATRHLNGLFYEQQGETVQKIDDEKEKKIPFDERLRHAIVIYEKSLKAVDESEKVNMFSFYIDKLLELDEARTIYKSCLKTIRKSLAQTLVKGYEEDNLSEKHFILFLQLRFLNMEKNQKEIEAMLIKGRQLYPNSVEFYELAIKYYQETNNSEEILKTSKPKSKFA